MLSLDLQAMSPVREHIRNVPPYRPCPSKGKCDDVALAGGTALSLAFFGFLWCLSA